MSYVLVFISTIGCSACRNFDWNRLRSKLSNKPVRLERLNLLPMDPRLNILAGSPFIYPIILLIKERRFIRYFNSDLSLKSDRPNKRLKSKRFGIIKDNGQYVWTGRLAEPESITTWVLKYIDRQEKS